MNKKYLAIAFVMGLMIVLSSSLGVSAVPQHRDLVITGLDGSTGAGSTVGPDGKLYIAEGAAGRISRVDPQTGNVTTFTEGLPAGNPAIGIGGPLDVAFIDDTAYAIVTLVGTDVGGSDTVGLYRVDGPNSYTVIADIGQYSTDNPPATPFEVPSGVQYAMEPYDEGFLVTDGHHNRVLYVTLDGNVSEVIAFGNIVPTGLEVLGDTVYVSEAGPTPHVPANGKIVSFDVGALAADDVAAGARLAVDVELGSDLRLYALSQGEWNGVAAGSPALPDTGALMRAEADGSFTTMVDGLDRPSSMEIIGDTFYIVTLGGEVWTIEGLEPAVPEVDHLVSGLDGSTGAGSTVGPDGNLYIAEGAAGRISSVDPMTGHVATFTEGLPAGNPAIGIGGPLDVAFIDDTAYAIVTLVGMDVGGSDTVGLYRIDGPDSYTVMADIGQFSTDNPPSTPFEVPSGVQYAMEPYDEGFLVTDGHHNRVLYVTLDGNVSEVIAFGNIVPTGLDIEGNKVYVAEAGPTPHVPANGKIVSFDVGASAAADVAAGARLAVDVEMGNDLRLYALSQGKWNGVAAGSPALPDTGALMRAEADGSFTTLVNWLDRPSSMEIIGDTFYVVTLQGEIWTIKRPPYAVFLSRI